MPFRLNPLRRQQLGRLIDRAGLSLAPPQQAIPGYRAHVERWDIALRRLTAGDPNHTDPNNTDLPHENR
ncbi:hypothetical protein KIH74_23990 [Kineosporia sp. J2-2]|uniref:Uncharacterized protein n=1 Tax=Kineosporia corallincola TaxID=2835133 RepID=A0ABS5TLP3_9ACTN|nr:hypothetical protein [Kineosporia corallincola]MBT0772025.1 hypothetical protein [Kineosporia corallincola]